jgi:hypothetical protein
MCESGKGETPGFPAFLSDSLELDGFRLVNPWQSPERSESRRHLPHLQAPESTYFVTFRCRTGLFLPDQAKEIVISTIRHWDGIRFDLDAAVVMHESFDHVTRQEKE